MYPTTLNCAKENRDVIRSAQDRMPALIHWFVFIVYGFLRNWLSCSIACADRI